MWKFFKIFMFVFLLIIAVPILGFCIYIVVLKSTWLGTEDRQTVAYLQKNATSLITLNDGLNSLFCNHSDSQVYIFGEMHGYADTQMTDYMFFEYLNKTFQIKHYVAEIYKEDARDLTLFLASDPIDCTYLDKVVRNLKNNIPQQSTMEFYNKWMLIYKYNQSLPKKQKIEVSGILGDATNENKDNRSSLCYEEFTKSIDTLKTKNEKFYCSVGVLHALQDSLKSSDGITIPFAARLKKDGYKVTSIIHIPLDSKMYFPQEAGAISPPNQILTFANAAGPIYYYKGIKNLIAASSQRSITLFNLDGDLSPYRHVNDFVEVKSCFRPLFGEILPLANNPTTDYFQYILLTRGSLSSIPYNTNIKTHKSNNYE